MQEWRAQSHSVEEIAGYKRNGFTLLHDQAEQLQGMRVTANFLSLLKVKPVLGRDFQFEEEKRGAKDVVIIGHQFWQRQLGGDESAVGKDVTLDGKPFTIIGVLPGDFEFPPATQSTELLQRYVTIFSDHQNSFIEGSLFQRAGPAR